MPNETNIIPLVDVLSLQLAEQVVMSDEDYIYLKNKNLVSEEDINIALIEQARLHDKLALDSGLFEAKNNLSKTSFLLDEDVLQTISNDKKIVLDEYRQNQLAIINNATVPYSISVNKDLANLFDRFMIDYQK